MKTYVKYMKVPFNRASRYNVYTKSAEVKCSKSLNKSTQVSLQGKCMVSHYLH